MFLQYNIFMNKNRSIKQMNALDAVNRSLKNIYLIDQISYTAFLKRKAHYKIQQQIISTIIRKINQCQQCYEKITLLKVLIELTTIPIYKVCIVPMIINTSFNVFETVWNTKLPQQLNAFSQICTNLKHKLDSTYFIKIRQQIYQKYQIDLENDLQSNYCSDFYQYLSQMKQTQIPNIQYQSNHTSQQYQPNKPSNQHYQLNKSFNHKYQNLSNTQLYHSSNKNSYHKNLPFRKQQYKTNENYHKQNYNKKQITRISSLQQKGKRISKYNIEQLQHQQNPQQRILKNKELYQCSKCHMSFILQKTYESHIKQHTEKDKQKYQRNSIVDWQNKLLTNNISLNSIQKQQINNLNLHNNFHGNKDSNIICYVCKQFIKSTNFNDNCVRAINNGKNRYFHQQCLNKNVQKQSYEPYLEY